MPTPLHLTPDGFRRLQRTLAHEHARLEEARRVVQEQMAANEQENQGLEAAQRDVMATLARIADLEDTLARAVLIERPVGEDDRAILGAVVTLLDVDAGRELKLQLVNPPEASALAGELPRVSTESPVGRELLGRRVGETFTVELGRRQATYRVLGAEF
jgi:transcription elongation factor GreA